MGTGVGGLQKRFAKTRKTISVVLIVWFLSVVVMVLGGIDAESST